MRNKLVVGNWKMNPFTALEAIDLARAVSHVERPEHVLVGVSPPTLFLAEVADALRGSGVSVYAQDVSWEEGGAHTGQISAAMVGPYVVGSIVGHSEVRRDLGDDDARVALKAQAALRHIEVIYCLGETLSERQRGETTDALKRQVHGGIEGIDLDLILRGPPGALSVAYEPIWAIGTGTPASAAQASEAIAIIRQETHALGLDADDLTVLYGGSVSAANVEEFARAEGVDGALVGGASLKPDEFATIVAAFR